MSPKKRRRSQSGGSQTSLDRKDSTPPAAPNPQKLEYTRMMYALQYSSGPLPSPATLEHYAQIVPGGAERIVRWAETQADHRQSLERKRVDADIRHEGRGQIFAFIITILSICGGIFLIYSGRDASGLALILTELVLLAGVFIYGRVSQAAELRRKMRDLLGGDEGEEKDD